MKLMVLCGLQDCKTENDTGTPTGVFGSLLARHREVRFATFIAEIVAHGLWENIGRNTLTKGDIMPKFTPGPWHIGMKPGPIVYDAKGAEVANMFVPILPLDENNANARLISKAPEMYAMLKKILTDIQENAKNLPAIPAVCELWSEGVKLLAEIDGE